jgi:hypothetical protein
MRPIGPHEPENGNWKWRNHQREAAVHSRWPVAALAFAACRQRYIEVNAEAKRRVVEVA